MLVDANPAGVTSPPNFIISPVTIVCPVAVKTSVEVLVADIVVVVSVPGSLIKNVSPLL